MEDIAGSLLGLAKTYGLMVAFLVMLIYHFFYKYVPAQAEALKNLVSTYDNRLEAIVSQNKTQISDILSNFRAEIAAKTEQSKVIFDSLSAQHKSMMEEMIKNNERTAQHTDAMMKLIQDNYQKLLDKAALFVMKDKEV